MGNPIPRTNEDIRAFSQNGVPIYGVSVLDGPLEVGSPGIILTNDIYIQP